MRCPTCGTANSDVLETRRKFDGSFFVRTRNCFNGHRFRTFEISEQLFTTLPCYNQSALRATIDTAERLEREKSITLEVLAGAKMADMVRKYGLPKSNVSRIVKKHAPEFNSRKRS